MKNLTTEAIKNKLTEDDVIALVTRGLGSQSYIQDKNNSDVIIFQTVCHNGRGNGKYKLYYSVEKKMFHCWTGASDNCGGSMDIFELVRRSLKFPPAEEGGFKQAYNFIVDFFNLSDGKGFVNKEEYIPLDLSDDWDILNKVVENDIVQTEFVPIHPNMLEYYRKDCYPIEWLEQGISAETMERFNIRLDDAAYKIIIPHYDIYGNLIGIRGRTYHPVDLLSGDRKYMPVYINNVVYRHALGGNLYGLYQNQEVIKKLRKVCIVEAEKSVLLAATYFNYYDPQTGLYVNNNFTVATCGSSISPEQIDQLLSLGVREIILAYDKENDNDRDSEQTILYEEKLLKLMQPLAPYVEVNIVMCYDDRLEHKDSPFDRGKDILLQLMHEKINIPCIRRDVEKKKGKNK